jgi:hypothetical protein
MIGSVSLFLHSAFLFFFWLLGKGWELFVLFGTIPTELERYVR